MSEKEFNQADRECEKITGDNHARATQAEREAACLTFAYPQPRNWAAVGRRVRCQMQLKRVMCAGARAVPCALFLAAIPRAWMDPIFALVMATISFFWALHYFTKGWRYD